MKPLQEMTDDELADAYAEAWGALARLTGDGVSDLPETAKRLIQLLHDITHEAVSRRPGR